MTPRKICPRCQTPAPMDAGFCGACGREYRTKFAPDGEPLRGPEVRAPQGVSAPQERALAPVLGRRALRLAQLAAAVVMFAAVLLVSRAWTTDHGSTHGLVATPRVNAPAPATAGTSPRSMPTEDPEDPVSAEARRVVERENRRLNLEPPAGAVDANGLIHLRNGGTITREAWEKAQSRVQSSPVAGGGMPPIPPF